MTMLKTQPEVYDMLRSIGMNHRPARIGSAIAMCEAPAVVDKQPASNFASVGDIKLADETWGYSYGGFQIRSLRDQKGTGSFRDEDELLDPIFNCKAARRIKRDRGNWTAWSCYLNGQYKAFLPDLYPQPPNAYTVLSGDTLSEIGDEHGISWQDLARWNNIHDPYTIFVGQIILLSDPVGA